ncbi:hypothetical protein [Sedimentibacter sp. LTW-03]
MSKVGEYIDNGPMEGFFGALKFEIFYGKRISKKLGCMAPLEYLNYASICV